jgi:hypothetical protein
MKFTVRERILSRVRPHTTWLEAGDYDVLRYFDDNRVIIDVTTPTSTKRQLTIVRKKDGILTHDKNKKEIPSEYIPA